MRPQGYATTQLELVGSATMGLLQTALARCDEGVTLDPRDAQQHFHRARVLRALGKHDEARASVQRCLAFEPAHPGALVLLSELAQGPDEPAPATPPPPGAWQPGTVIEERWELFGSARGGMGVVYFVRDRALEGLELAVKTLAPRPHAGTSERARVEALFRRETQVWLELGAHPHIVSGFFTLPVQGSLRFFMEYVPGLALDEVLRRKQGSLALPHALDLAIQLAAGLAFVHARGVVHRDVKPPNCLVMPDGTLRLTDFGLGKVAVDAELGGQREAADTLHALGLSIAGAGTPEYMAPEQWRSLGEAGQAADVYAFGALLHELLTGHAPFVPSAQWITEHHTLLPSRLELVLRRSVPSRELLLMLAHEELTPRGPAYFRPEVPAALDVLTLRCLAKVPDARPSMDSVLGALRELYAWVTGAPYGRAMPGALEPSLAGENNRALSYAVMGEHARAVALLDAWLAHQPTAPRPWLNRQTLALRSGERAPQHVATALHRELLPAHPALLQTEDGARALAEALAPFAPAPALAAHALEVSHDGALIALAAGEKLVILEGPSGHVRASLEGHQGPLTAVALHGTRAATASFDRTVRLWDAAQGAPLRTLRGHLDQVTTVCFSPEGALLASGGGTSFGRTDAHVCLWRVDDGALLHALSGHRGGVTSLAFSHDGALLASADGAGSVHLWERRGAELYVFAEEGGAPVRAMLFAREGGALGVVRGDGSWRWCSLESGDEGECVKHPANVLLASFCPASERLALLDEQGFLWVYERDGGGPLALGAPGTHTAALAWEGDAVLAAGPAGVTRWWLEVRAAPASPLLFASPLSAQARLAHEREVQSLLARVEAGDVEAWEPLSALRERTAELQRRASLALRMDHAARVLGEPEGLREAWLEREVRCESAVEGIAFAPDGGAVVAVLRSGTSVAALRVQLSDGTVEHGAWVDAVHARLAFACDDGLHLVCATERGELVLARRSSGRIARTLLGAGSEPTALAVARGTRFCALGDAAGLVRLSAPEGRGEVLVLRGARAGLCALAFASDGETLAGAEREGRLLRWRVRDGALLSAVETGEREVVEVALEGERVLCVGERASVWSWEGALLGALPAQGPVLTAGALCPDGALVATAGWGPEVTLWGAGHEPRALHGHGHGVRALGFSPDGVRLATVDHAHTLRLWVLERRWRFRSSPARG